MQPAPVTPGERRPIAARQTAWARGLTRLLLRAGATPNGISVAGMLACVAAAAAFFATSRTDGTAQHLLWLGGALLVQARLLANMLDGMVAVESGRVSPVGELFNEVPDRVSDVAALVGFGYAAQSSVELGYAAAVVAVMVAYVRAQGKAAGARHEFCGPMAKPHRMLTLTVAAVAMALPIDWDLPVSLPVLALGLIVLGGVVTMVRRLARVARVLRGEG